MTGPSLLCCLFLLLGEVISVSVMEGESVTLQTGVKIQTHDVIEWKLNGIIIADLTGPVHDAGFTNSEVNKQTGDLNITDIRRDQSGDYEMKINSSSLISHRRFSVTVREVISVSVMKGESVTLQTGVKIQTDDVIQWNFNDTIIANLTGPVHERFRNSEVNKQTGDLIITDIRRDQSGDYELRIKGSRGLILHRTYRVIVREVITVSVGESVTLQTDVKIQSGDVIQWKFKGDIIADLSGPVNERVRNSEVKPQTGNLRITNIRGDQFGDYEMKINSRGFISHRRFSVTVREVITVSVGESVTLQTDVNLQTHAVIQWKFNGIIIADLTGPVHDAGFTNSEVNKQTGDLNITHITRDQFGDYEMKINSRSLILHRRFSVKVSDAGLSSGAIAGICILVLSVIAAAAAVGVFFYRRYQKLSKEKKLQGRLTVVEDNNSVA